MLQGPAPNQARRQFTGIAVFAVVMNIAFQLAAALVFRGSFNLLVRGLIETIALAAVVVPPSYYYYTRPFRLSSRERRNAERWLRKSEMHYRIISELTTTFVFDLLVAENGEVVLDYVSDDFYAFSGRPRTGALSLESLLGHVHPDDKGGLIQALQGLMTKPSSSEIECRAYVRDAGELRWLTVYGRSEWDGEKGRVSAIYGAAKDITESKTAAEALSKSETHIRTVLRATPVLLWDLDADGTILLSEGSALAKLGLVAGANVGKSVFEVYKDTPGVVSNIRRGLGGEEITTEGPIGDTYWSTHFVPRRDERGNVQGLVGVSVDISDRRRAEENQQKTRALLAISQRLAHIGSWEYELTTGRLTWSDEMYQIAGLPAGSAIDLSVARSLFPADELLRSRHALAGVLDGKSHYGVDMEIRRVDGEIRTIHTEGEVIKDGRGEAVRIVGTTQDITERRLAENAIRSSEQIIQAMVSAIPAGVFWKDRNLVYMGCNRAFARDAGFSDESQVIGKDDYEIGCPRPSADYYRELDRQVIKTGQAITNLEDSITEKDAVHTHLMSVVPLRDVKGVINGILGTYVDITERKQAEEALRESEERFRSMFKYSAWGMVLVTIDLRFLQINEAFAQMLGYAESELLGKTIHEVTLPEDRPVGSELAARTLAGEMKTFHVEKRYVRKNGTVIWALVSSTLLRDSQGKPRHFVTQIEDITERKKAEAALKESEAKFRSIIQESADGIIVMAEDGTIVEWNKAEEVLTGARRDDVVGLPVWEVQSAFVPREMRTPDLSARIERELRAFLRGEKEWATEKRERRILLPDGSDKTVLESAFLVRQNDRNMGVSIHSDVTERKRAEGEKATLEQHLQKLQKLEALGVLAGGIAHDFNNILMGIYGFMELATSESSERSVTDHLVKAMESMERARGLTQQLLTFSKGGAPVRKVEQIAPLIMDTCRFTLHGSNVKGSFDVDDHLWNCNIDRNQVAQVIQNLMINAIQAMPMGGVIEITGKNVALRSREHPALPEGAHVCISIKDQGIGIPEEMIPRIFDPFFTTKAEGHGLGLAISHSIVARHRGTIDVTSELGKGTTFTLYLPACGVCEADEEETREVRHVGKGVILVMDDDEAVRTLLSRMLQSFGYSTVCKSDGKSALEYFRTAAGGADRPSAVVLDLTIPGGIGGREVAEELRKMDREVPIFVSSGYAVDPVMANPGRYGITASLRKPFKKAELMEMLEKHMGSTN